MSRGQRWTRGAVLGVAAACLGAAAGIACGVRGGGAGTPSRDAASAVLFIGDGMGPGYVTAARLTLAGTRGRLRMDEMPHTAVMRTWAADSPVTDSAAAASAMACGRKTVNGVLCQDETARWAERDGNRLESIALWAKRRGLRVGIVTTTTVTHATPAAFYAVHNDRERERDLARQAIAAPLDFLLGGGRSGFAPREGDRVGGGWEDAESDGEDLEAAARARGWTITGDAAALRAVTALDRPVLGLFAPHDLPYEYDTAGIPGGRPAPTLVEMTGWAIDRLLGEKEPFLLVIEGGRIDHAGHANRGRATMAEMKAMDEAIGLALDRLEPGTTLVLVTADHETGGLVINGYPEERDGVWGTYTDTWSGVTYPVLSFATGPGLEGRPPASVREEEDRRPSGIGLPSAAHTGTDVILYAWGRGAEHVRGTVDNTAVYRLLRAHLEGAAPDLASPASPPR